MVTGNDDYAVPLMTPGRDQKRIEDSVVTTIGAGTTANCIGPLCAKNGIGYEIIYDFDICEGRNIAKCLLLNESDIGRYKAVALAKKLEAMNPRIRALPKILNVRDLGHQAVAHSDCVIGCFDNDFGRIWLNRLARATGTPYVDIAIGDTEHAHSFSVRVFMPGEENCCFECDIADDGEYERAGFGVSCALEVPPEGAKVAMAPDAAFAASGIAAYQVLRIVQGEQPTFKGILDYFQRTNMIEILRTPVKPNCLGHRMSLPTTVFVPFDENTTIDDLYLMVSEKLGKPQDGFGLYHLYRELAITKICNKCGREESCLMLVKHLKEGPEERCPCGGCMVPGEPETLIPPGPQALSFYCLDVFGHIEVAVRGSGQKYHVASTHCESKERFIDTFIGEREVAKHLSERL